MCGLLCWQAGVVCVCIWAIHHWHSWFDVVNLTLAGLSLLWGAGAMFRRQSSGWRCQTSAFPVSTEPPRYAKFLLLLVPKRNRENILGDIEEEYRDVILPDYGLRAARLWYWSQVSLSLAPLIWTVLQRVAGLAFLWKWFR